MGMVDPGGHTKPAAQGRHVDALEAPTVAEKVPVGQGVHLLAIGAPALTLYVPAMQAVQLLGLDAPARMPYVPAGQRVHVDGEEAPTVRLYVPGGQGMHEEGACAYVPAGQLVVNSEQVEAPDALYESAAHGAHGATPLALNVPGRHPRVSVKPMLPLDCENVRMPPRKRVDGGFPPGP